MALSKNSYYRGFDWFIQFGLLTLLLVAPFEDRAISLYQIGQAMALIGLVGRCAMDYSKAYFIRVAVSFVLLSAFLIAVAFVGSLGETAPYAFADSVKAFASEYLLLLLATILIVYHRQSVLYERIASHPKILAILGVLGVYWLFTLLSAMTSLDPGESLRAVRKEIGPYFIVVLLAIEAIKTWTRLRRFIILAFIVGAVACLVGCLVYVFYSLADRWDWPAATWLSEGRDGWIRTHEGAEDIDIRALLQFPFDHHNRLGSFGVIVTMLSLACLSMFRSWKLRSWILAGGAAAFIAVVLSGTRGAMIAAVLGVTLFILMNNWRYVFVFAAALVLGYLVAPETNQERVRRIFQQEQWSTTHYNIARRLWMAWAAQEMVSDYPVFGIGYGSEVFKDVYFTYRDRVFEKHPIPELGQDPENKSHAHNNFLQIAAGSGLPALILYLFFNILLAIALIWRWLRPPIDAPWFRPFMAFQISLLFAIHVYGMTNYSLRGGAGLYIWLLMAAMIASLQMSAQPVVPLERPKK